MHLNEEPDDGIKEEIEDLLENVPVLKEYFHVINKIGSGTFSTVYVARLRNNEVEQLFALKYIIPTSHPNRIVSELQCLRDIGGSENVMGVKCCLRHRDHVVIVMPYFPHEKFMDYVCGGMSVSDVCRYMQNLLHALRHVHSHDVIHRDVKPSNFLFNRKLKQYALVDFGLAQKCKEDGTPETEVGTPKAPTSASSSVATKPAIENKSPGVKTEPTNPGKAHPKTACRISPRKRKSLDSTSTKDPQNTTNTSPTSAKLKFLPVTSQDDKPLLLPTSSVLGELQNISKVESEAPSNVTEVKVNQVKVKEMKSDQLVVKDGGVKAKENLARSASATALNGDSKAVHSPRRAVLQRQQRMRTADTAGTNKMATVTSGASGATKQTTMVVRKNGKPMYKAVAQTACECFGRLSICTVCASRSNQHAPRAGTPGFRAPEVLLKYQHQNTAVDIWSAGVIFLSLLSWRYPFFKAPDDINALAQIMCAFGSKPLQKAAKQYGKMLTVANEFPETDLKILCEKLRKNTLITAKQAAKFLPAETVMAVQLKCSKARRNKDSVNNDIVNKDSVKKDCVSKDSVNKDNLKKDSVNGTTDSEGGEGTEAKGGTVDLNEEGPVFNKQLNAAGSWDSLPDEAYDLLRKLLDLNPLTRITAAQALKHPFFAE